MAYVKELNKGKQAVSDVVYYKRKQDGIEVEATCDEILYGKLSQYLM